MYGSVLDKLFVLVIVVYVIVCKHTIIIIKGNALSTIKQKNLT